MDKSLLEFAVEIVQSQASTNTMTGQEIESALIGVYNALHRMQLAEAEGRPVSVSTDAALKGNEKLNYGTTPDPRASIHEDKVSCLECGSEFRQLTANHLKTHQLTPKEYKRKWGFPLKQSLAAKALTRLRSRSAKKRGLPQKLRQYLDDQREKKLAVAYEGPKVKKSATGRSLPKSE